MIRLLDDLILTADELIRGEGRDVSSGFFRLLCTASCVRTKLTVLD